MPIEWKSNDFEALANRIKSLETLQIQVGWFGTQYPGGQYVATVAAIQEYTPGKSFIRSTLDGQKDQIQGIFVSLAKDVLAGKPVQQTADKAGQEMSDLIRKSIVEEDLIETGLLRDSLTYRVII